MEIKTYKKIKGNMYSVKMDDGSEYKLFDDIILKYELLISKNIDKPKLERVLEDNTSLEAYYTALKYISLRMRSEDEIKKYLRSSDYSSKSIKFAVDRLKKEGYLNEERYVEAYVNDQVNLTLNGPKKIKSALLQVGCSSEIVDGFLEKIERAVWQTRADKVLAKRSKVNKVGEALFKNKMYSELVVLGYDEEIISECLNSFSLDTDEIFLKEANKTFNRLSSKYGGQELKMRFKNKMYSKGFSGDIVSDYLNKKEL